MLHRVPEKTQGGAHDRERWLQGTWLGKRFTTDENIISLSDGKVVRARNVRTNPATDSWDKEMIQENAGQPWDPSSTLTYSKLSEAKHHMVPAPKPE